MPTRKKKAGGRKTKYSVQMRTNICKWLKKGCSYKDACAMEGISYQTFNEWKKEKSEFSDAIKKAEVVCKAERITTILKASEKSWQAAAWWLERRYGNEYGRDAKGEDETKERIVSYEEFENVPNHRCKTIEEVRKLEGIEHGGYVTV